MVTPERPEHCPYLPAAFVDCILLEQSLHSATSKSVSNGGQGTYAVMPAGPRAAVHEQG